ncbi:G-type lectin S-receptor-like serine/threonine-protein kinase [Tanacetum coccineum]
MNGLVQAKGTRKKISEGTVVWVAKRETPINDTSGMFKVSSEGNLQLFNGGKNIVCSSSLMVSLSSNNTEEVVAQLLDDGNLIVRDKSLIWQSFDFPTNTLLAGMKIGKDLATGLERIVLTWDKKILIMYWIEQIQERVVYADVKNDSFAFVHELKKEMHADLKYVESLKKEVDELESDKVEFSNIYDMLLQECVSNDVMCSYLHLLSDLDTRAELQCLYVHKVKECECLAQKLSKQTEFVSE